MVHILCSPRFKLHPSTHVSSPLTTLTKLRAARAIRKNNHCVHSCDSEAKPFCPALMRSGPVCRPLGPFWPVEWGHGGNKCTQLGRNWTTYGARVHSHTGFHVHISSALCADNNDTFKQFMRLCWPDRKCDYKLSLS